MVVRGVMCQWWLAHWRVLGMCVIDAVQWIGCFLRLLCCGSVGGCVMCERWLARWRGDRCVLFASGLGLAVLCGCCCA